MKKQLFGLAIGASILAGATTAQAEVFNGAYVGGAFGWQREKASLDVKKSEKVKSSFSFNHMPLSLHLGYVSSKPSNFLWGVEAGIGYAFKQNKVTIAEAGAKVDGETLTAGQSIKLEEKTKLFTELLTKFGWNWDQVATYLILGVSGQQTEYTAKGVNYANFKTKTKKSFLLGFVPGAGAEVKITDSLSGRIEYKYHIRQSSSVHDGLIKIKHRAHDIRVGVSYAL